MAKGLDLDKLKKYLKVGVLGRKLGHVLIGVGLLVLVVILLLIFMLKTGKLEFLILRS